MFYVNVWHQTCPVHFTPPYEEQWNKENMWTDKSLFSATHSYKAFKINNFGKKKNYNSNEKIKS
jgi:hypothetical protein